MVVLVRTNKLYAMSWILLGNSVIKWGSSIKSVPVPVSAEVTNTDPDKVIITFDQLLDETSVPATTDFVLTGKTISNVEIDEANVILTVTVRYEEGDEVIVSYTKPELSSLVSLIGNLEVNSFSDFEVTNNFLYDYYELVSIGTGLVVAAISLIVSSNIRLLLTGTAKFYSDSGGTLDESTSWDVTTGGTRTAYIRCPSGTSQIKIGDFSKITSFILSPADNSFAVCGNIEKLVSATIIKIAGLNNIQGDISNLNENLSTLIVSFAPGAGHIDGSLTGDILSDQYPLLTQITIQSRTSCSIDISGRSNIIEVDSYKGFICKGSLSSATSLRQLGLRYSHIAQLTYESYDWYNSMLIFIYNGDSTHGWSIEEITLCIIDAATTSGWSGHAWNEFIINGTYASSMADTNQGGIWGDFSGVPSPSSLATAFKTLWKTKLAHTSNKAIKGITAPGASGDGTGFPAGFGDWYRS